MRLTSLVALGVLIIAGPAALACSSDASCEDDNTCGTGAAGGASGSSGIGGSAGASASGGSGGSAGDGGTCDTGKSPSEEACLISEDYGVFVSPTGDDTTGDGSRTSPYKTLTKGLSEAKSGSKKLYACADGGSYVENIVMDASLDGTEMYGGFKCSDWTYSDGLKALIDKPSAMPLKVSGLSAGLTIEDFDVQAADASGTDANGNGSSSIAMLVATSQNVTLRRVKLTAGKGAAGANGAEILTQAETGEAGKKGSNACVATPAGGVAATTKCGGANTPSVGGKGGNGAPTTGESGGNGSAGQPSGSAGQAGTGQLAAGAYNCAVGAGLGGGNGGDPGTSQPAQSGGAAPGSLDASGFVPSKGGTGLDGTTGQGGGGGGGAMAPSGGCAQLTGASGGSGGGGGCGGKGGGGGGGGGASIALASVNSGVIVTDSDLVAADAGAGGDGGQGQPGGSGGAPGPGGTKVGTGSADACPGGMGGPGGDGGHGGGGAGGASVAIAYTGTAPTRNGGSAVASSSAAAGGKDGLDQSIGPGAGAPGLNEVEQQF